MGRVRSCLTYANVASTMALVLALGLGTSYAVSKLGKNSVKSKNIAPGAVQRSDLHKNAIDTKKVADGSLRRQDFRADDLQTFQGPPGTPGSSGLNGERGTALQRAHLAEPAVITFTGTGEQTFQLTDSSYTQGAREFDQIYGSLVTHYSNMNCTGGSGIILWARIGGKEYSLDQGIADGEGTQNGKVRELTILDVPGSDTDRKFELVVRSKPGGGGSQCSGTVTINSTDLTALRFG